LDACGAVYINKSEAVDRRASLERNSRATTWLAKKEIAKDPGCGALAEGLDRALSQIGDAQHQAAAGAVVKCNFVVQLGPRERAGGTVSAGRKREAVQRARCTIGRGKGAAGLACYIGEAVDDGGAARAGGTPSTGKV